MSINFANRDPSHYKRYATALQVAADSQEGPLSASDVFGMSAFIERNAYMMDNRSSVH